MMKSTAQASNSKLVRPLTKKTADEPASPDPINNVPAFYHQVIESLEDYAVFTVDLDGRVRSWNKGAERLLGYQEGAIIGRSADIVFVPEDRAKRVPQKELKTAAQNQRAVNERYHLRKDGSRFWGSGLVFPLKNDGGELCGFTKIMRDLTERKNAHEQRAEMLLNEQKNRRQTEASERLHRTLIENSSDAIALISAEGLTTYLSPAVTRILGYEPEEMIGKSILNFVVPEDAAEVQRQLGQILTAPPNKLITAVQRARHKKGHMVWIESAAKNLLNDRAIGAIVSNFRDVSERKKTEERQLFLDKLSKILFTSFEDNLTLKKVAGLIVPAIADYCRIATLDEDNNICDITVNHTDPTKIQLAVELYDEYKDDIDSNQGVHNILKTGQAEIAPVIDKQVLDSIDNPRLLKIVKQIGLKSYMGAPMIANGKIIGAITFSSVASDRSYTKEDLAFASEIGRRIALALDNARLYREAKQAHLEAENERQRLHELFMQTPAAIGVTRGPDHVFEFVNPLYLKLVGRKGNLIGKTVRQAFPEVVGQGYVDLLDKVYKSGKAFVGTEMPLKLHHESRDKLIEGYVNFVYQPFKDHKGRVQGIMAHAVDVTEQVAAKRKLLESEERFALAQRAANIGTFEWNIRTNEFLATPQLCRLYGLRVGGFEGRYENWLKTIHPKDRAHVITELNAAVSGQKLDTEFRIVRPNRDVRWLAMRAQIFYDDDGQPERMLGINSNVTKRKEAEEDLRDSEERFRQLADSMPQMVWTAQADGNIDYYNKQWYDFTGFSREQIAQSWESILHPDDVQYCNDSWNESVRTGQLYQIEYRFKDRHHAGQYRWFLGRALPIKNKAGKVVKWFGTCTDIDDVRLSIARQEELEAMTRALTRQREQLMALNEAKDEFISLASHQLRTPATGVKQYIGLLREGYVGKLTKEQQDMLQYAHQSNERQLNIIEELLQVAHVDAGRVELNRQMCDISMLASDVIHEQSATTKERGQKVEFKKPPKPVQAWVDKHLLRMVIENLLDNASKYSPPGTTITLSINRKNSAKADCVVVRLQDQGVGIKKSDQKKLFQKFSRIENSLSVMVGGSGLGLYWAKQIVDLHGGQLSVESRLNKGSCFTLVIPIKDGGVKTDENASS